MLGAFKEAWSHSTSKLKAQDQGKEEPAEGISHTILHYFKGPGGGEIGVGHSAILWNLLFLLFVMKFKCLGILDELWFEK